MIPIDNMKYYGYIVFFSYSPVGGYLGCFHSSTAVNSASMSVPDMLCEQKKKHVRARVHCVFQLVLSFSTSQFLQ